jgi:hypothetical protein
MEGGALERLANHEVPAECVFEYHTGTLLVTGWALNSRLQAHSSSECVMRRAGRLELGPGLALD